jgi:hypothetical protein
LEQKQIAAALIRFVVSMAYQRLSAHFVLAMALAMRSQPMCFSVQHQNVICLAMVLNCTRPTQQMLIIVRGVWWSGASSHCQLCVRHDGSINGTGIRMEDGSNVSAHHY